MRVHHGVRARVREVIPSSSLGRREYSIVLLFYQTADSVVHFLATDDIELSIAE